MSASIEHLLHVQREKQRLDDELRIAREIQKSLLPVQPPRMPGLDMADLCEPAREVGGDYYDFFDLGPRQLGVLIADVSGKGTSAALYMAELKGLMLALSHTERSPRRLLIDVNRRLAEHLDNRSFITMTYAVIDLEARTLTCARAGHTPLIVVSGGRSEVVMPGGMVLGLRLPGASGRFEELLEEHTRPIHPGDVIVLYTDGITEAMDAAGELFGDAALARVVESQHHLDAAGIRERVLREVQGVRRRRRAARRHDDGRAEVRAGGGSGRLMHGAPADRSTRPSRSSARTRRSRPKSCAGCSMRTASSRRSRPRCRRRCFRCGSARPSSASACRARSRGARARADRRHIWTRPPPPRSAGSARRSARSRSASATSSATSACSSTR